MEGDPIAVGHRCILIHVIEFAHRVCSVSSPGCPQTVHGSIHELRKSHTGDTDGHRRVHQY